MQTSPAKGEAMLALLLSLFILLLSWMTAHFVAIPLAYVIRRTRLEDRLFYPSVQPLQNTQRQPILRGLIFAIILVLLDVTLAAMLGLEPVHLMWKNYIQNFVDFELTQTVLSGLLDDLVLFLGVFIIFQTIRFINVFFPRLYGMLDTWRQTRFHVLRLKSLELLTPDQITDFLISLTRYMQIGLNLLLGAIGFTFILSFFPGTQGFIFSLIKTLLDVLSWIGQAALNLLPNLFTLLVIVIVTRYTLKLLGFLYHGFQLGKIKIAGLHPELAEPTYQLLRFFVVALALVTAYPYIPGSDSPVFRGITIFAGALLSLGSTSLVTNIISGVVLTYTRGLRIGDRVKIGDTVGDVVERTLLVTRVRTIKNVVITIPNGMVLNNEIINYSAQSMQGELILNTTVTIGYDVPWRQVHQLLIRAARATGDILTEPEPFVLQTSLDDYYVSYELNAYTCLAHKMALIYSELHQNIQDSFNEAGVEIMSPGYTAFRDGNAITIPVHYRPADYEPPKPAPPLFQPAPKPQNGASHAQYNDHGIKTRPL
jgi:small-conductance mechanosensitive channel